MISASTEWGEWKGRRRKACPGQPLLLTGQPIGMYHCEGCGMVVVAAIPHPSPSAPQEQDPRYLLSDYEDEMQQEWPPGYEE